MATKNGKWSNMFKGGSSNNETTKETEEILNNENTQSEESEANMNHKNEKIKNLENTISDLQEKEKKLLYALAEKENQINLLRQDVVLERESFAIKFIKSISKELDDLFRIMDAMTNKNPEDSMIQALKSNADKFIKALEKINVKVTLPKIGDDFDDKFHDAITQIPDENLENGKIANVASACYMYGDKVISHAMVVVVNNG